MVQQVGVIGLGTVGPPIAARSVAAGHPVALHNLRPEAVAARVHGRSHMREPGARWKDTMKRSAPGTAPPNLRKDLQATLETASELGVPRFPGNQASLIADAGLGPGPDYAAR